MRHANRVLAALLSLAVITAAVLLIIEVIADRASNRPAVVDWQPAYDWARRTTWNAGSIRVTCAVLILAGLVLLIAELKPARVSRLAADPARRERPALTPPTPAAAWPPPSGPPPPASTVSGGPP
jgi:Tryptophan-associated transmembrane protein (Trp_oprn_chp).